MGCERKREIMRGKEKVEDWYEGERVGDKKNGRVRRDT